MPNEFSSVNLAKLRQLRPFKIDYSQVRQLDYIDKDNLPPQTFDTYRGLVAPTAMETEMQARPTFPADLRYLKDYASVQFPKGRILILINSDLYPSIKTSVNQYIKDVAYEGWFATTYRVRGGTPDELRSLIKGQLLVAGVLMVGSLPVAWFEMADDFHGAAEFPCDLYFMDMNGTWMDPDGDGKFSEHPSGVAPEVWVGHACGRPLEAATTRPCSRTTSSATTCSARGSLATSTAHSPTSTTTGAALTTARLT